MAAGSATPKPQPKSLLRVSQALGLMSFLQKEISQLCCLMSSTFSRVKTIFFQKTRATASAGQQLNKGMMLFSLEVITQVQKSKRGQDLPGYLLRARESARTLGGVGRGERVWCYFSLKLLVYRTVNRSHRENTSIRRHLLCLFLCSRRSSLSTFREMALCGDKKCLCARKTRRQKQILN